MKRGLQDLCPKNEEISLFGSRASRNAIHTSAAYICSSPDEANLKLGRQLQGYVYQRDGHPNADSLATKCRQLHEADHAVVTSSGMSATALAIVSQLAAGDHVLLSHRLYGRTSTLLQTELVRFGVTSSLVDMSDYESVEKLAPANVRMLIVETISNPDLRVVDLRELARIAQRLEALLLVDNTFASPIVCRPLALGADLVVESLTKVMNGHGDVTMGLLCARGGIWERVPAALASWGMTAGPFDCWLAERGLATLFLRMSTASENAKKIAIQLSQLAAIDSVSYPGLESHADHPTAIAQFGKHQDQPLFGNMVTISLGGGWEAASRFIGAASKIPFCPSLGELSTTLSHPVSTSHRSYPAEVLRSMGISGGTIRLSIGLESPEFILAAIQEAADALDS